MTSKNSKILVIDDDISVCKSLEVMLKRKGYQMHTVNNFRLALDEIHAFRPDLILLDMNFTIETSGKQGLKLLGEIQERFEATPIILMTGWATVQLAVKGMKMGAKDFVAKPWDNKHLAQSIETILSLNQSNGPSQILSNDDYQIIGQSEEIQSVLSVAKNVAQTHANVLITGESGTGKELVAEAIHQWSLRPDQKFVKVNLGGISTSLFESEMFGHKKGAFTDASHDRVGRFELANKGTIFLDEIGELPLVNQVKLLRVLQEQTFEILGSSQTQKTDVRVISATNKNLENMVDQGTFREDLLYRVNLIHLHIPALRERRSDIPLLVDYFIKIISNLYNVPVPFIRPETYEYLQKLDYPGNIRQLKNIVDRTFLINLSKKELEWKDFKGTEVQSSLGTSSIKLPHVGAVSLEEIEIQMIKKAFSFHNGSISQTAKSLGITRSALYRRLEKYGIQ